ncbi:hypothetical protein GGI35DRAFT_105314 [Trichoderma velutinum]
MLTPAAIIAGVDLVLLLYYQLTFSAVQRFSATTHVHEAARSFPGVAHGMNLEIRCNDPPFVYAQGTAVAFRVVILMDTSSSYIEANSW